MTYEQNSMYSYPEEDDSFRRQFTPSRYPLSSSPDSRWSVRSVGRRSSSMSSTYSTSPTSSTSPYSCYSSSYSSSRSGGGATSFHPSPSTPSCASPSQPYRDRHHSSSGFQQYQQQQQQQQTSPPTEYICLFPLCTHASSRKADLERHVRFTHNRASAALVDCSFPGCNRLGSHGFTRKDKMVEHLREVHKVDVPKRGGGAGGGGGC